MLTKDLKQKLAAYPLALTSLVTWLPAHTIAMILTNLPIGFHMSRYFEKLVQNETFWNKFLPFNYHQITHPSWCWSNIKPRSSIVNSELYWLFEIYSEHL